MNTIQKWEYMTVKFDIENTKTIREFGEEGWELCTLVEHNLWIATGIFKRPIMPEPEIKQASDPEVITPNKKTSKHLYWAYLYLAACILCFINSVMYFFNSNYPAMRGWGAAFLASAVTVFYMTKKILKNELDKV